MLHDAGNLVLATNFPDEYAATREAPDILAAEIETFGAGHSDVGAYLLGLWGLPDPIVEAAAFHHAPAASPGRDFTPLVVVHVVAALLDAGNSHPRLDSAYLTEVGVGTHLDGWIGAVETAVR
jgi:HD-like signal output (HDOD) protein